MPEESQGNSASNAAANVRVHHARLDDVQQFTPEKINHFRRGGIREGAGRAQGEMQQMLEKVPPSQRAGVDAQSSAHKVKEYLSDKDASHIKPHSKGGSSDPSNIKWENKFENRTRGDRPMTQQEQMRLGVKAQFDNLTGALKAGVQAAPKGAVIGAVTTLPFSALRNALRVVRGEVSASNAASATAKETVIGGGVGAITAFTVTTIATACPPIAIALSAISPALLVIGGAGMVYEFFKILDDHKQQVRDYYDSLTQQDLKRLQEIEDELQYEHAKNLAFLDQNQALNDEISNRPRGAGIDGALRRYLESAAIARSLGAKPIGSRLLSENSQKSLPSDI